MVEQVYLGGIRAAGLQQLPLRTTDEAEAPSPKHTNNEATPEVKQLKQQ